MPNFLLRKKPVVPAYPNTFLVILTMPDGYELEVGQVAEQTGLSTDTFWAWSCPGANGRSDTQENATSALKAAWRVSDEKLAEMRHQQEWTANKYALTDAGYQEQIRLGTVHCPCGETFDPKFHEQTMAHISHITGRSPGT